MCECLLDTRFNILYMMHVSLCFILFLFLRWTAFAFLIFHPWFPWCLLPTFEIHLFKTFGFVRNRIIANVCSVWNVLANYSHFIYAACREYIILYTFIHIHVDYNYCKQWPTRLISLHLHLLFFLPFRHCFFLFWIVFFVLFFLLLFSFYWAHSITLLYSSFQWVMVIYRVKTFINK